MTYQISRQEVVNEALTWIGTPWQHGQSTKECSCDCVGFLAGVGRNIGFLAPDERLENYHRIARGDFLLQQLSKYLARKDGGEYLPGDVLVFKKMRLITHVGFYLGQGKIIHSDNRQNIGVIVNYIDEFNKYIYAVYEIPGIY